MASAPPQSRINGTRTSSKNKSSSRIIAQLVESPRASQTRESELLAERLSLREIQAIHRDARAHSFVGTAGA